MRYLILALLFTTSCARHNFVPVTSLLNVPRGTTQFYVDIDIETAKEALHANTISYYHGEFGLETEDILLDERTRAKYDIYPLDSTTIKVVPHWGITKKWKRVVYKSSEISPKKVFDYGVGLFNDLGHVSY